MEEYGARKKSKIVGVGDGDVGMEMGGGGGGFEVEDDMSGDGGGGGGFFPSGSTSPPPQQSYLSLHTTDTSNSNLLPLSSLPSVMNLLNLSVDDDVLTIFDSFNGTGLLDDDNNNDDDSMNQGKIAGYTNIKDFRAVCAAMMEVEPEPEADGEEEGMQVDDAGPSSSDDGDSKDEYKENSSDLSSEEDEIQGPKTNNGNTSMDIIDSDSSPKKVRRTRKTPTTTSSTPASNTNTKNTIRSTKPTTTSIPPPTKRLTPIQREHIQQLWDQMFSMTSEKDMKHYGGGAGAGTGGNGTTYGRVLGKEQVGKWSKEMGEEWSDVEVSFFFSGTTQEHVLFCLEAPLRA